MNPKNEQVFKSPLLKIDEAAKWLQVSEMTLYRHVSQGKIKGALKVGGSWRINREVFERELINAEQLS